MPEPPDGEQRDFFISHAGSDQRWAEWVGQQLVEAGFTVELDVWEWAAGQDFAMAMERAMERALRMITIWTASYFVGPFAHAEHTAGFSSAQPGEFVIPVLVEQCIIPRLYSGRIFIDLRDLSPEEAKKALLRGIRGRRRPRAPVPFPGPSSRSDRSDDEPVTVVDVPFPRLPPVWNVPVRSLYFTGREQTLARLAELLSADAELGGPAGRVALTALHGMGGIGKTQIAIEYAHRHLAEYQIVWWIAAEDPSTLVQDLADLARELGDHGGSDVRAAARWALGELGRRSDWLLIYDNVPVNPAEVVAWLPPVGGHVLITSRSGAVGRIAVPVEIREFDRDESIRLLRRRFADLHVQDAGRIAAALGDLPLAVEQAGAYLYETGTDAAEYLELLRDSPEVTGIFDQTTATHPGLLNTIVTSLAELRDTNAEAADLFDRMAFLAPEPLPLLTRPDPEDTEAFGVIVSDTPAHTARTIAAVTSLALARRDGTRIQVHRLVQLVARHVLRPEHSDDRRREAQNMLASARWGDPEDPSRWARYAELGPHALDLWRTSETLSPSSTPQFRDLLVLVAKYLFVTRQNRAARQLTTEMYERWRAELGEDDPHTLHAQARLASSLHALGDPMGARRLNEDVLARRRRALGDNHPDALAAAGNLAIDLYEIGDYTASEALSRDTLTRFRIVFGEDDRNTLRAANNLIYSARKLSDPSAVLALAEDTLKRYRRVVGEDHPDTLVAADTLFQCVRDSGDHVTARRLAEDVWGRRKAVLGPEHPDTLESAVGYAASLRGVGELAEARRLLTDSLDLLGATIGADHPVTLDAMHELGLVVADMGDVAVAKEIFEKTFSRRRERLGNDHPDTLASWAKLQENNG